MEKNLLGKSGLKVSILGLGTWVFGGMQWGGAEDKESIAAIDKALEVGINLFDTAPGYGGGKAEKLLGETIKDKSKVVIATKVSYFSEGIESSLDRSLKRLRMDYVDILFIHWPSASVPIKRMMEEMGYLKEKGKIKAIGVSNFNLSQLKEAVSCVQIDVLQPPYNLYWRFPETDLIPFCIQNKIAVVPYSPLGRGILSGKFTRNWQFKNGDDRKSNVLFLKEHFDRALDGVEKIKKLAEKKNASVASVALRWVSLQKGITSILLGARNTAQLMENLKLFEVSLTEGDLDYLDEISRQVTEPIKQIGYDNPFCR
jgi:myo-inositol catabolism protein IolS